jgi:carboxyl-terminal processing protease
MKYGRLAVTLACTTLLLSPFPLAAQNNTSETYRALQLFGDVFERVRSDYVEDINEQKLIEDAVNGMLTALDPHSSYLSPNNFRDMQVQTRGEFGGLGIEVTMENGLVKIVSPIDETPAARAGLRPNDFISAIDGEPVIGLTLQEAVDKMRGPVNSSIKITIRRGPTETFDVTLQRAVVRIQSVRFRPEGTDIGYIRITSFTEQTDVGLRNAITKLKEQMGTKLKGIVLDLRNNPGGLLDQSIAVSDEFLEKGEIVSTRGRRSEDAQRYNAKTGDMLNGMPIVVLINGGSASASEIVAGALQDHHRAVLLGTKTFGKGSVQTIIPLGGQGAIRLTTARYFTPSGRSIQAQGIEPDIVVEQARIERVAQGSTRREADLRGALANPQQQQSQQAPAQPPAAQPPAAQPAQPGDEAAATVPTDQAQDYQLSRALDLLRGIALFGQRTQVN